MCPEKYKLEEILGMGGGGVVYAAKRNSDGLAVAVKKIPKKAILTYSNDENHLPLEVTLMQQVADIPGVIKLLDYFDKDDNFYVVMERCYGIDLFDFIQTNGPLPEDLAKKIFSQVVNIIIDCHAKKVLHRDIKDENLLIDLMNNCVKLIDFGCGTFLHEDSFTEINGTQDYYPPEWNKYHHYKADGLTVWTLGILLYTMLCADTPCGDGVETIHTPPKWPAQITLSPFIKNIVNRCLNPDPKKRISLPELKQLTHSWQSINVRLPTKIIIERNLKLLPHIQGTHVHFNLQLTKKYEAEAKTDDFQNYSETNYMQRKADADRFHRLLSPILTYNHRLKIWKKIFDS